MTTIVITCSLVVLLFGFDLNTRHESNGSFRRPRPGHTKKTSLASFFSA